MFDALRHCGGASSGSKGFSHPRKAFACFTEFLTDSPLPFRSLLLPFFGKARKQRSGVHSVRAADDRGVEGVGRLADHWEIAHRNHRQPCR